MAGAYHSDVLDGLGHQFSADDVVHLHLFDWPTAPFDDEASHKLDPFINNLGFMHQSPLVHEHDDAGLDFSRFTLNEDARSVQGGDEGEQPGAGPPFPLFGTLAAPPQRAAAPGVEQMQTVASHAPSASSGTSITKKKRCCCFRPPPRKTSTIKKRKPNPRFKCLQCDMIGTDARSLRRHIWADHSEYAERNNIPTEMKYCTYSGCNYRGRKDNVLRHWKKKHSDGGA